MLKKLFATLLFMPTIFALEDKTWQDFAELTNTENKISIEDLNELNSKDLQISEIIEKTRCYIGLTTEINPKFRIQISDKKLRNCSAISLALFATYLLSALTCYPSHTENFCHDINCNPDETLIDDTSPNQCLSINSTRTRTADYTTNSNLNYFLIGHLLTLAPLFLYLSGQGIKNLYRKIMHPKKTKNYVLAMQNQLKEIEDELLEFSTLCPTLKKYFPWNQICPAEP